MAWGGMFYFASVHAAETRVGIALVGFVVFGVVASRRWERPFPMVPVLVLCLIVAGWLFGATLVWGTGSATKVRWSAAWTYGGDAWQWTALLAVALVGVLCLGLALRAFARESSRRAWLLSAASGTAFIAWSAVVRYSVVAAIFVLLAGTFAVALVGSRQTVVAIGSKAGRWREQVAILLLVGAIIVAFGWAFYAFAWLVVGPEGRASCKCWADFYNDWEYRAQFVVALGGAVCLVAAAGLYVMRRRVAFGVTGTIAALAACGWIVFLLTGLG
jgi:hypothetical protein